MDTMVLRERITERLRRPPSVHARSRRATDPGRRLCGELLVTSFADLKTPGPRPGPGQTTSADIDHDVAAGTDHEVAAGAAHQVATETDHTASTASEATTGDHTGGQPVDAAARLRAALTDLGVNFSTADSLTELAQACATVEGTPEQTAHPQARDGVARGRALVGSIETLAATVGRLDALVLSATTQLTAATGSVLLADKDATSPEELTAGQRRMWRAQAKKATRAELGAALGWTPTETAHLVALANTPASITTPVTHALTTGQACWRLARRFYRDTTKLDTEDAAAIGHALFGDDPAQAVTERLDSTGAFTGRPWFHKEFYRALDREIAKINARDPDTPRRTRENNLAGNDVRTNLDEHGTGCLMIGCTTSQGAAITDRIERAARAARAGGDPRTLPQLRVAVAVALLLHGTVDLTDLPEDPDLITVEQSTQLTKILHGLPTAQLNVIVPLNTLIGTTPTGLAPTGLAPTGTTPRLDAGGNPIPAAFAGSNPAPETAQPAGGGPLNDSRDCTCTCTCGATAATGANAADSPDPDPTGADRPDPGTRGEDRPDPGTTGQGCSETGPAGGDCPDPEDSTSSPGDPTSDDVPSVEPVESGGGGPDGEVGVAEVIGRHCLFLSPDEVRTLALTPGSTMYRLLTDPATGALIERSSTAYRFDTAMRSHIIAADVFCRAPGCLNPASLAQIDHVQEHGTPGGHTCISNGQPLDAPHHDLKTKKLWDAILAANRDVTWTTLLGRIYTTKTHDYNQYTRLLATATTEIDQAITAGADPATVIDAAIYQALSYRPPGAPLGTEDDNDWAQAYAGWDQVTLTHTLENGTRTYHPAPEATRAETDRLHTTRSNTDDTADDSQEPHEQGNQHDGDQGKQDQHGRGSQQDTDTDEGPTPWTHDPDAPPPF